MSGEIYFGSSKDGGDAKQFRGVYINPSNSNEWSTAPYNKEQKECDKECDVHEAIINFCYNRKLSHEMLIKRFVEKPKSLKRSWREFIAKHWELCV